MKERQGGEGDVFDEICLSITHVNSKKLYESKMNLYT